MEETGLLTDLARQLRALLSHLGGLRFCPESLNVSLNVSPEVSECKGTFFAKNIYRQGVCCAALFHLTAGMRELGTDVTYEAILDMKRQILLSNHNSDTCRTVYY